jgi:hypothetical protein
MIEILADLDDLEVLKPVYEAQVCSLLYKYAADRNRDQELDWAEKMKIACNNVIHKEKLDPGSNSWQYFHDLEVEADDYLKIWETQQKEIDAQDALDRDVHDPTKQNIMSGEGAAARRAAVELKSKRRYDRLMKKVLDSQETFYHTYEGANKEDLRQLDEETIESSLQAAVESDDEELSDAEGFDEREPGEMSEEEQIEEDDNELPPPLDDEKQAIADQLEAFLRDDNLLPHFKKFITKLGRKQARNQWSTSGSRHVSAIKLVRIGEGAFEVVDHDEEEAEDTAIMDAAKGKKRKYPDEEEAVGQKGDDWQMGEQIVLTQRPKNQRMDDGV